MVRTGIHQRRRSRDLYRCKRVINADDQEVEICLVLAELRILHVDQALRDVDLVVGMKFQVFFGVSFLNHALQIDG